MRHHSISAISAISAFALSVCVLSGSPARAAQEVAARVSAEFGGDGGLYATGSSRNLVQGELGYAHTLRSFHRWALWLEGSWTIGERHDRLFDTFDTSVIAQQFTGGARATIPIRRWLVPTVRAGVGALIGTLRMNGLESGGFSQTSAAFTSYALAGVQLLMPRPWRAASKHPLTAGVVVEGGYCYSSDLRYSLRPAGSADTVQMPSVPTDLGALSLSGPLLRVGLLLQF